MFTEHTLKLLTIPLFTAMIGYVTTTCSCVLTPFGEDFCSVCLPLR
jgi:hypothetical protein